MARKIYAFRVLGWLDQDGEEACVAHFPLAIRQSLADQLVTELESSVSAYNAPRTPSCVL